MLILEKENDIKLNDYITQTFKILKSDNLFQALAKSHLCANLSNKNKNTKSWRLYQVQEQH